MCIVTHTNSKKSEMKSHLKKEKAKKLIFKISSKQTKGNHPGYIPLQPRVNFNGFETVVCKLHTLSK